MSSCILSVSDLNVMKVMLSGTVVFQPIQDLLGAKKKIECEKCVQEKNPSFL